MTDIEEIVEDAVSRVENFDESPRMAVITVTDDVSLDPGERKDILDRVEYDLQADGGPDIDGDLLDDLEDLFADHVGKDNAITSGAVADELGIDDAEGNPKTREAIRILLEERKFPIISCGSQGYCVPESEKQVDEEVGSLKSRAHKIQQRAQLIKDGWDERKQELVGSA